MKPIEKPSWVKSFLPGCCIGGNFDTPSPALPANNKKKSKSNSNPRPTSPHSFSSLNDPNSLTLSEDLSISLAGSNIHSFTVQELKLITQNFSSGNFLGEGGFGPVHKGFIDDKVRPGLKAQPVAVKLLDLDGSQGHREWLAEVMFLGKLRHPHLVKLIGYCCEDEHRLLMYEYMPRGSLENQLFRRFSASLPWLSRMKIAVGAAKGLAFLHEAEKPVIYRDFKASNILLDSDFTPKLSDFGLAKDGPEGDESHVSTRILGTQGYAAPEYIMTGHLTKASDVYSFGVVLVELLTGRRSMDKHRPQREQNLADWARPQLNHPKRLSRIMDPRLEGQYSESGAKKAAQLAYQCLSLKAKNRPEMSQVVRDLEPLLEASDIPSGHFVYEVPVENSSNDSAAEKRRKDIGKGKDKINEIRQKNGHHHRSGSGEKRREHHSGGSGEKRRSGSPNKSSSIICSDPRVQKNLRNYSPMHRNERGA